MNQESINQKNNKTSKKPIILMLLSIALIMTILGITLAINITKNVSIATGNYNVLITGSTAVSASGLVPIPNSGDTISYDNLSLYSDSIFVSNFTVKGAQTNPDSENISIIYDVALIEENIDTNLLNRYLKWELIKNQEVLSYGNFSDVSNNTRYVLTDIQQDLPKYTDTADSYRLVIWISDDFSESFDQSIMMNKSFSATIDIELYTQSKISQKVTDQSLMMAYDSSYAFWQSTYQSKITNITFKQNTEVPSTALTVDNETNYWDITDSTSTSNKKVIAYVEDDGSGNGTYSLTIGGDGMIYAPADSSYLFSSFVRLETISFNNSFNTSNVTNMSYMFNNCSLTSIDLSSFDTSKVTNMSDMFFFCEALASLDLRNFDVTNVTSSDYMFEDVPSSCIVYVSTETMKSFVQGINSSLTNIVVG